MMVQGDGKSSKCLNLENIGIFTWKNRIFICRKTVQGPLKIMRN